MAAGKCVSRFIVKVLVITFIFCHIGFLGFALADVKEPGEHILKKKDLIIGLIPEQNIFKQIDRYTPLADYLSHKTGVKIRLKILTRYGNIVDNFVSSGLDGAFFGSFTYVLAHKKIGVEVVARPESPEGISTYHGLIFVRQGSGIKNANDMKGKRFVFVDTASTGGYLFPLDYFKRQGVESYKTYLKEVYFAGTHEDAIYDVLNKKADIGAAKNTVFNRLAEKDKGINGELEILARSPEMPENGLALRKDIDSSVRSALTETLLKMNEEPAGKIVLKNFGAGRFIITTDKDYEPVRRLARKIGLDIAKYDYRND